jgi:hypothetical protein
MGLGISHLNLALAIWAQEKRTREPKSMLGGGKSKSPAMFDQVRRYQTIHYPCQSLASIASIPTMMTTALRPVAQASKEMYPEASKKKKARQKVAGTNTTGHWPLTPGH